MSAAFRVLHVGCGDAALAETLSQQLSVLHYDGVEPNAEAAAAARARLEGLDVAGRKILERRIEDLAALDFGSPKYEAVVAFDLLQTAPSPEAFLAALERRCALGGTVYLAVPNGVQGKGANPYHLRAYTAGQIADICRRRGRLLDLQEGEDGRIAVAYSPQRRRGRVVIHTGGAWEPWGAEDITRKGLGGSETAAVRLAHHLSELGWVVDVYGRVREGMVREVRYLDERKWAPGEGADLLIASRVPEIVDAQPVADKVALWLHDTDCGPRLSPDRAAKFDHLLTLSGWHSRHVAQLYPYAKDKIVQIRNGIHPPYYDGSRPWEERDPLLVYTSSPDRGLDVMLDLWPEIYDRCRQRDVKPIFAFAYSSVYDAVAAQSPEVARFRERVAAAIEAVNERCDGSLDPLGSLPQPKLAELMGYARVWAHPAWHSASGEPFMETFCIGAVEAQASGCYVVAANRGALPEVVKYGSLVGGERSGPADEEWTDEFIELIVEGLCADRFNAPVHAPSAVSDQGWEGAAVQVAQLMEGGQDG